MAKYKKKIDDDIRCPLEYGLTLFGGKSVYYSLIKNYDIVKFAKKCIILQMQYWHQR